MTDEQLIARAKSLQKEALRILEDLKLLSILGAISEPEVVGSVKNGLMIMPDIDIHARMEEPSLEKIAGHLSLCEVVNILPTVRFVPFRMSSC